MYNVKPIDDLNKANYKLRASGKCVFFQNHEHTKLIAYKNVEAPVSDRFQHFLKSIQKAYFQIKSFSDL